MVILVLLFGTNAALICWDTDSTRPLKVSLKVWVQVVCSRFCKSCKFVRWHLCGSQLFSTSWMLNWFEISVVLRPSQNMLLPLHHSWTFLLGGVATPVKYRSLHASWRLGAPLTLLPVYHCSSLGQNNKYGPDPQELLLWTCSDWVAITHFLSNSCKSFWSSIFPFLTREIFSLPVRNLQITNMFHHEEVICDSFHP